MGRWAVTTSWESHPCISKLWWGKFSSTTADHCGKCGTSPPSKRKGVVRKKESRKAEWSARRQRQSESTELSGRQCQPAEMAEQRRAEWSACQRQREHKEPTDGPTRPAASSREREGGSRVRQCNMTTQTWVVSLKAGDPGHLMQGPEQEVWSIAFFNWGLRHSKSGSSCYI